MYVDHYQCVRRLGTQGDGVKEILQHPWLQSQQSNIASKKIATRSLSPQQCARDQLECAADACCGENDEFNFNQLRHSSHSFSQFYSRSESKSDVYYAAQHQPTWCLQHQHQQKCRRDSSSSSSSDVSSSQTIALAAISELHQLLHQEVALWRVYGYVDNNNSTTLAKTSKTAAQEASIANIGDRCLLDNFTPQHGIAVRGQSPVGTQAMAAMVPGRAGREEQEEGWKQAIAEHRSAPSIASDLQYIFSE